MMADALYRHWHMLRLVPRHPTKRTTAQLRDALSDRGFTVDIRSVQRDLQKLSAQFPLICDERSVPYGWSWSRDAAVFDVPGIDLHTALAFCLAADHLGHLLPHATFSYLAPHFGRARMVLEGMKSSGIATWADRVRVIPSGMAMVPPQVDRQVLEAVHDGLGQQRQVQITYKRRGESSERTYHAHPLGLVYKDAVAYLVCTLWSYEDVKQLVVHRMTGATVLPDDGRVPDGFSLTDYIASGELAFRVGDEPLPLVARFDKRAIVSIQETPLAAGQSIVPLDDGRFEVAAEVLDTVQLRVWLRSFGEFCEVVSPESLRREIADSMAQAAALYGS